MKNIDALVDKITQALPVDLRDDASLRKVLIGIIKKHNTKSNTYKKKKSRRRKPGLFDPMKVYRDSPGDLHKQLESIEIEQLKDIIAEQGMDQSKLAMKWKSKERLIELILSLVKSRSEKGDVFRK